MKLFLMPVALITMVAQAGTITEYFDRASFNAAVGNVTLEDFTPDAHFPISTGVLNASTNLPDIGILPGDILPGVTYSTPVDANSSTSNEFNIDGGGGEFSGGFLDSLNLGSDRPLTIAFEDPVQAFGFDTDGPTGGTSQLVGIGQMVFTLSLPDMYSSPSFFGFVSSAGDIGSVTLTSNGTSDGDVYGFALDNFTLSESGTSTTPEPHTWALVIAGLVCFVCLRRVRSDHAVSRQPSSLSFH